jgi:LmbE family N-acetylglucosaminyl deacetylase
MYTFGSGPKPDLRDLRPDGANNTMNHLLRKGCLAACILISALSQTCAQNAQPVPGPDDRYKADVLLVIAHPDDETNVATYLWKAVLDEGKRVAVVITTRGNSGFNVVGMEQSKALEDVREIEGRRSLAAHGITNVWYLHGTDTPTQDVLGSLETLGHGEALEDVVRIIRLTRPEVILTWLPAYVDGENHGDHQAAAVVATEAFDLAGSPLAFPEQVTPPRDRLTISNYGEGLHPWQAKKLYFFSNATHQDILSHRGPMYLATDISRRKGVPFVQLNKSAWDIYASQNNFKTGEPIPFIDQPEYMVLGKSLVTAPLEGDILSGIGSGPLSYVPPQSYSAPAPLHAALELGGPWVFYSEFYPAHGLKSLENLVAPETEFIPGHRLWVPLLLRNNSRNRVSAVLHTNLPSGWTGAQTNTTYNLEPDSSFPVQLFLQSPPVAQDKTQQLLQWSLDIDGKAAGKLDLVAYPEADGLPQ